LLPLTYWQQVAFARGFRPVFAISTAVESPGARQTGQRFAMANKRKRPDTGSGLFSTQSVMD